MKIVNAIVCDDIRQETNGKFILVGVYADEIVAHELPLRINLSFMVQVKLDTETSFSIEARTVRNDGTEFVSEKANFGSLPPAATVTMFFVGTPTRFEAAGHIALQFRQEGGEWFDVVSKNIVLAPELQEQT